MRNLKLYVAELSKLVVVTTSYELFGRSRQQFAQCINWATLVVQLQAAKKGIPGIYIVDLEGSPITVVGRSNANVSIVIVARLSGAHLDSIASLHGVKGPGLSVPNLDRLRERMLVLQIS